VYQSTTKFLLSPRCFLGSLQFITDRFGDLILQETESSKIIRSGTGRLPPARVRVDLKNEVQIRLRHSKLEKTDLDPVEDKASHTQAIPVSTIDPIYQSSPESDSKGGREIYMVGNDEELLEKAIEEI
jgi:hypothetical protein